MKSFVIGQTVTIADAGLVYPFCEPAAKQFGLTGYRPGAGLGVQDGTTGTVKAIPTYFDAGNVTLMGIALTSGIEVVVDVEGVV